MLQGLGRYEKWAPLLLRVGVGLTMFFAGYGKVTGNAEGLVKAFTGWGIPMPSVMAPVVTYVELIGGLLILLGFLTRVAGLLIAADMTVAILAVKWAAATKEAFDFTQMRVELLLLLAGLSLAVMAPGPFSLESLMGTKAKVPKQA